MTASFTPQLILIKPGEDLVAVHEYCIGVSSFTYRTTENELQRDNYKLSIDILCGELRYTRS